MSVEQTEAEIAHLDNKVVVIVRPYFGQQSDSFIGNLSVIRNNYPIKFHFEATQLAILFTVDDVSKLEEPIDETRDISKVIYLKGPQDYAEIGKTYQVSH